MKIFPAVIFSFSLHEWYNDVEKYRTIFTYIYTRAWNYAKNSSPKVENRRHESVFSIVKEK